jgi:hypothetical protein
LHRLVRFGQGHHRSGDRAFMWFLGGWFTRGCRCRERRRWDVQHRAIDLALDE